MRHGRLKPSFRFFFAAAGARSTYSQSALRYIICAYANIGSISLAFLRYASGFVATSQALSQLDISDGGGASKKLRLDP